MPYLPKEKEEDKKCPVLIDGAKDVMGSQFRRVADVLGARGALFYGKTLGSHGRFDGYQVAVDVIKDQVGRVAVVGGDGTPDPLGGGDGRLGSTGDGELEGFELAGLEVLEGDRLETTDAVFEHFERRAPVGQFIVEKIHILRKVTTNNRICHSKTSFPSKSICRRKRHL